MPWENPGPGITRQIMAYDGQLMMVKVHFEKGAVGTLHEHYHSQATYVASGKFELTIGTEKRVLAFFRHVWRKRRRERHAERGKRAHLQQ